jgi:hypothetical protein
MENAKLEAAVYRYQAMAGLKKDLPPKAARRAREDRKRYAEEYVLERKGKTLCDPVRMVRFLVDVCGLTMQEASKAVRAALRRENCGAWPAAKSIKGLAEELYRRTGDMADAMSMARFLGWSSALDANLWEAVRVHLAGMRVTREATGIENWQEAAE